MRILTTAELSRCNRAELGVMFSRISKAIPAMPIDSEEWRIALANLQNIRRMLARPVFRPG